MTRVAPAAASILSQATMLRPRRSKASDGTVGDRAHRNRVSDHNPDRRGIVHAADLTHDPKNGVDAHAWAKWLAARNDRRVKYIISNRRIWEPGHGWSRYGGENPHDKHVHVSVLPQFENDTSPWFAGFLDGAPAVAPPVMVPPPAAKPAPPIIPAPIIPPNVHQEDDMKVYALRYANAPTEYWLLVGTIGSCPACAINLNQTPGEVGALSRIFTVEDVIGDLDCNTFKTFTHEVTFAEFNALGR